jgi:hypothetical protein
MLQRVVAHRTAILNLLEIPADPEPPHLPAKPLPPPQHLANNVSNSTLNQPTSDSDQRLQLYQNVVRQIQHILMFQTPDQGVESVQQLLDYLQRQGISTETIQKKVITQVIVKRAKQDQVFQEQLLHWEKTAQASTRSSTVGEAIRMAIALL